jgi:translation initiation factor IF-2
LGSSEKEEKGMLDIVLKCDSMGTEEAIISSLAAVQIPNVKLRVIHAGVGSITKSDLLMAVTGSRLVVGFNVDVMPLIDQQSKEQGIEVRLYEVIYKLTSDLQQIARSLTPREVKEKITGKARIIQLFKSSRKGVILGCEVLEGRIVLGKIFRIISAMGLIYTGKIKSLHIEENAVKEARVGQQVGLKISDFDKATLGDLVECYETLKEDKRWHPRGGVFRFVS